MCDDVCVCVCLRVPTLKLSAFSLLLPGWLPTKDRLIQYPERDLECRRERRSRKSELRVLCTLADRIKRDRLVLSKGLSYGNNCMGIKRLMDKGKSLSSTNSDAIGANLSTIACTEYTTPFTSALCVTLSIRL